MSIELKPESFGAVPKDKAKILIAQPVWNKAQLNRDDENRCYKLSLTSDNEKFIDSILDLGLKREIDLIVFPEFSIPQNYHDKVRDWSTGNQIIVVAGSANLHREGKYYNTASVFFGGKQYRTEKHNLSPLEVSGLLGEYGPSSGTDHLYFLDTPVGKLAVMICADEFDRKTRAEFQELNFDILCVIAFQSKAIEHHQSINEIVKESNEGVYVAYSNALCQSSSDGRSAFFGAEYKDRRQDFISTGLNIDDGLEMKLVEMPSIAGCFIVECNLKVKKPTVQNRNSDRALVNAAPPFIFEKGCLRQLDLEELKREEDSKSTTAKAEYQPSIPPVQPFMAEYIGRQSDIDYLNEFLTNEKKHFLLLYGVGGIGKTHLLSCCMQGYKLKTFYYHKVDPKDEFTLNRLFEICFLPQPDAALSSEEKQNLFVRKFQEDNIHLILDDYYEVGLDEVKSILKKLVRIGRGKLLLISRVIPPNINHIKGDYFHHKILPLSESDFERVIRDYILEKNIGLRDEDIHLIYERAQGYPLGGRLIIDARPYSKDLAELLDDLGKFEAELDPDGRDYSGRILDNIFHRGNNDEMKLLCEFSALFGPSDIETIRQLPSYKLKLFEGLHSRKSFIDMDADGKFSSHAMIRDFAYHRLLHKEALHLRLARYFESKISGRTDDDWKWLNEAILHYTKAPRMELSSFIRRVERNFETRNIKGQIDKNSLLKTIRNYTTLISLYPGNPAYYNELGIAYRMNRQLKNAIETFERALTIDHNNTMVLNELGITYRENDQKTKAIETFQKALDIKSDNVRVLNELGITYRESDQKSIAIETFNKALAIESDNVKVLNELGITYRENNQKNVAIETFERALAIEPDNGRILNELGISFRQDGNLQMAIDTFQKRLKLEPNEIHSLTELGITYRENNQVAGAIRTFESVLEIDPEALHSLNQLGITYRENKQNAKAIATFMKALDIEPDGLHSLNELGITYQKNKQSSKAIEIFERALGLNPENVKIINGLGITYRKNNQKARAINTFERAMLIEPDNVRIINELGIAYRENNQKAKAMKMFEKALMIAPESLQPLIELGITCRENNEIPKAIETFQKILSIDPESLPALNELSLTYRAHNQIEEAIEICKRIMGISNPKQISFNLLQIYLFFKPDKEKAKINFDISKEQPRHSNFDNNRNHYLRFIDLIMPIQDLSLEDFKPYDKYLDWSLRDNIRAYHHALELLYKLNEKFPANSKIISRLGRTLSNKFIARYQEGWKFCKEGITLLKMENNPIQLQTLIISYFNSLLNQQQMELLETEMKAYAGDVIEIAHYFRFMAHYSFAKKSNMDEAIGHFEKAIHLAEGPAAKREFAESLLRFLSEQNSDLYKKYYSKYLDWL